MSVSRRPTRRRWPIALITVLALAGCASSATPGLSLAPSGGGSNPARPSDSPTASELVTSPGLPAVSPHPSARLLPLTGHVFGTGTYPDYSVLASTAWSSDGAFTIHTMTPTVMGISVWDVGQVPLDPCHWRASLRDTGTTVDDLVRLLVEQRLRNATIPEEVSLGGYPGKYLEWSVPADSVVTGDSDFKGCDDPGNGHHDFVSWLGNGHGERYEQVAGQVDRLWVLDVAGRPLLVDATYSPDATQALRDELGVVVASLQFEGT